MLNQRSKKRKSAIQELIDESKYADRKLVFNGRNLRFESEKDLESYLDDQFEYIFPGLALLARQYTMSNQRCDLLCYKRINKQGVIVEIKNQIDRYVVPQLVRYRKILLLQQPFADLVDYSLPLELIAIAPKFHEDNYTDKEACKFEENIHFLDFSLSHQNGSGELKILGKIHNINFPIAGLNALDPDAPSQHYSLLPDIGFFKGDLPQSVRSDFIKLHSLFMRQLMVKHWATNSSRILYSTGKGVNSKKLAEITNTSRGLYLYLWLPSRVKTNVKLPLARFGLFCDLNCSPLSRESTVKWIVCTNNTINTKEEPGGNIFSGVTRQGMPKWTKVRSYLGSSSLLSSNTRSLLISLITEFELLDIDRDLNWWDEFEHDAPINLGWYIDLAIAAWNHQINK
jgi:hypothetical protein